MCCLNEIENEFNFGFYCPFYWEPCNIVFHKIKTDIDFVNIHDANRCRAGCSHMKHLD